MIILFLIGAAGYSLIEYAWRGYTHWTMAVTGGVCFVLIFIMNTHIRGGIILRSLAGMAVISLAELVVGLVVNVRLGWDVWDYSALPMNFKGQVCLPYAALWFFLCIPVIKLCDMLALII